MIKQFFNMVAGQKKGGNYPPLPSGYTAVNAIMADPVIMGTGSNYTRIIARVPSNEVHIIEVDGMFKSASNNYTTGPAILAGYTPQHPDGGEAGGAASGPGNDPIYWGGFSLSGATKSDLLLGYCKFTLTRNNAWGWVKDFSCLFSWNGQRIWTPNTAFKNIKIYDFNDTLRAHLQPCQRDSDGMIGYYDIVNNDFWYAAYPNDSVSYCWWIIDN